MKPTSKVCSGFALLLALAACGGAKKNADSPENADDTAGEGGAADNSAAGDSTPTARAPAPGDDAVKKATPCSGFDIADLVSTLSQTACEVQKAATTDQKDLKGILEI